MKKGWIIALSIILVLALLIAAMLGYLLLDDTDERWQEQYDLGIRYYSEGNYQAALLAFQAAIEIDPKMSPAYSYAARACIALGDPEAAKEILEQGIDETGDERLEEELEELEEELEEQEEREKELRNETEPSETELSVPETTMPAPTPEADYEVVLAQHRELLGRDYESQGAYVSEDLAWLFGMDDAMQIYYALYDINNDGVMELIIGAGQSREHVSYFDAYSHDGTKPVRIIPPEQFGSIGYRASLTFYDGGHVMIDGSGGASTHGWDFFILPAGESLLVLEYGLGYNDGYYYRQDATGAETSLDTDLDAFFVMLDEEMAKFGEELSFEWILLEP